MNENTGTGTTSGRGRAVGELVRKLAILTGLLGLVSLAQAFLASDGARSGPGEVTLILGFALIAGHLFGRLAATITLPLITGYLLAGVLLGPFGLDFVGLAAKGQLAFINHLALGLIALSAGGELRLEELRPRLRGLGWICVLQVVVIFVGMAGGLLLVDRVASGLGAPLFLTQGMTGSAVVAMALVLGLVGVANSPSSTVAVIKETRAAGPLTTLALGVTVIKDVAVVVLMAFTLAATARLAGAAEQRTGLRLALDVGLEIGSSFALGALLGWLVILYLRRVGREVAMVALGVVLIAFEAAEWLRGVIGVEVHFLLACMLAGFLVENASESGRKLIAGVERSSLPVYVIFFTFAGVGLDLDALRQMWPLAVGLVLWRGALVLGTTWAGGRVGGEPTEVAARAWTALLAQAGISLGLAELVALRYPEMGGRLRTLLLATIAINQLIGPVLFKRTLARAGEAGQARWMVSVVEEEEDELDD